MNVNLTKSMVLQSVIALFYREAFLTECIEDAKKNDRPLALLALRQQRKLVRDALKAHKQAFRASDDAKLKLITKVVK